VKRFDLVQRDEERGHIAVAIECHKRAPRHASPLSFAEKPLAQVAEHS
jgi:hypothetical protein